MHRRLFGEEGYLNKQQQPARGSLGSVEYKQQEEAGAASPSLPPSTWLSNKQSQMKQEQQPDTSTDDALLASSDVRPLPTPAFTPAASTGSTGAAAGAGAAGNKQQAVGADHPDLDPLHDNFTASEKEAEQLSALSRVIQQQQDTITKQVRHA